MAQLWNHSFMANGIIQQVYRITSERMQPYEIYFITKKCPLCGFYPAWVQIWGWFWMHCCHPWSIADIFVEATIPILTTFFGRQTEQDAGDIQTDKFFLGNTIWNFKQKKKVYSFK